MTTSVARGYIHERLDAYRSDDRSCMEGTKRTEDIIMSEAVESMGLRTREEETSEGAGCTR